MNAWEAAIIVGAVIASLEAGLAGLVRYFRPSFQWLIVPKDERPSFPPDLVAKHVKRSFDPDLGWRRAPNSSGEDEIAGGVTTFHIDGRGRRLNPGFEHREAQLAAFGDSFTFCRLVDDHQTWPHLLSRTLDTGVDNFGVGNYGFDQALLRLERELPSLECKVVIMGVVPETISRVHSYWKHYFEYGNTLAFKPRFILEGDRLVHHPPAVRKPEDFETYAARLEEVQALDPFYRSKFRKDLLRFPYLPRILVRWRRHIPILWHLSLARWGGKSEAECWREAFASVVRDNARVTARLFQDRSSRRLLERLVERFCATCRKQGSAPILLVLPQPVDLERRERGHDDYGSFFARLGKMLPVVDMTESFLSVPERHRLYVEGRLGPHVSLYGNRSIAQALAPVVRDILSADRPAESVAARPSAITPG